MARWHEEEQRWTGGRGREGEDERRGEWRGSERGGEDRGRERWMSGERGEAWRGGSRGDEWRDRGQERWTSGGEYERGGLRGHEWGREDEERGGGSERWRAGHVRMGWHGESGSMGEGGYAGGEYGGSMRGGSRGGMRGGEYGGREYGTREFGGRELGGRGEWDPERGRMGDRDVPAIYREAGPEFTRSLRRYGGEEERGTFERMGDRMKEGFRKLTGRGPKGYKRSDERIREDVSERIARSWVNAEEVEVKVESGEVTLTGFVYSREEKRVIEDVAEEVFGVEEVNNHLRIHREDRSQTFSAGSPQKGTSTTAGGTQAGQRTQQGTTPTQQPPGRH
jgi:hypothetical protein